MFKKPFCYYSTSFVSFCHRTSQPFLLSKCPFCRLAFLCGPEFLWSLRLITQQAQLWSALVLQQIMEVLKELSRRVCGIFLYLEVNRDILFYNLNSLNNLQAEKCIFKKLKGVKKSCKLSNTILFSSFCMIIHSIYPKEASQLARQQQCMLVYIV